MGHIPLEITVKSAQVFNNVNLFSKMHLYTIVRLLGDSSTPKKRKTTIDEHSGSHPFWWFSMTFLVDESKLLQNNLNLSFQVKCSRNLGDKSVGILTIPIKELYDSTGNRNYPTNVAYTINSSSSGKPRGVLYFSYMFGGSENKSHAMPSAARLPSPNPISPAPSAPYISTGYDDEEYVFSTNNIDSSGQCTLPVNGCSFRSSVVPSAPYLPVDYGC
ncbi:hypothetical protein ACH5RR_001496 [Cinchona calisaya]|uniref:C2 domain-containing protein n=1 Tax=Cinchona calisaya TaxID=153742 RepID=A0ABD3B438_9GENT